MKQQASTEEDGMASSGSPKRGTFNVLRGDAMEKSHSTSSTSGSTLQPPPTATRTCDIRHAARGEGRRWLLGSDGVPRKGPGLVKNGEPPVKHEEAQGAGRARREASEWQPALGENRALFTAGARSRLELVGERWRGR